MAIEKADSSSQHIVKTNDQETKTCAWEKKKGEISEKKRRNMKEKRKMCEL